VEAWSHSAQVEIGIDLFERSKSVIWAHCFSWVQISFPKYRSLFVLVCVEIWRHILSSAQVQIGLFSDIQVSFQRYRSLFIHVWRYGVIFCSGTNRSKSFRANFELIIKSVTWAHRHRAFYGFWSLSRYIGLFSYMC